MAIISITGSTTEEILNQVINICEVVKPNSTVSIRLDDHYIYNIFQNRTYLVWKIKNFIKEDGNTVYNSDHWNKIVDLVVAKNLEVIAVRSTKKKDVKPPPFKPQKIHQINHQKLDASLESAARIVEAASTGETINLVFNHRSAYDFFVERDYQRHIDYNSPFPKIINDAIISKKLSIKVNYKKHNNYNYTDHKRKPYKK
jgi:hypothetical protein